MISISEFSHFQQIAEKSQDLGDSRSGGLMRVLAFALLAVLLPAPASAGTDIAATCYQTCADSTHSTPKYKACVARAADKADQFLNETTRSCKTPSALTPRTCDKALTVQLGGCAGAEAIDRLSRSRLHLRRQPRLSAACRSAATIHHAPRALL